MSKTSLPWTLKQVKNMHEEKATIKLNHPIQRKSDQWDLEKKSLLVHSILDDDYVVPQFFFLKETTNEEGKGIVNNYYVIDGKQRLSTLFDFCNGKFKLHKDTPLLEREDSEPIEIADKTFAELDSSLQEDIMRYKLTIVNLEDIDDDKVEEIFRRLNNGTALSSTQIAKAKMGMQMAIFTDKLLGKKFFAEICRFSASQLKKADDLCALLQGMMLLDSDYEYDSISQDEALDYAISIKNNYTDEQREELEKIIDYLGDVFIDSEKYCKKINIPILMIMAKKAIQNKIDCADYLDWYHEFFKMYTPNCDYAQYCSSGSIKKEKTQMRISIMQNSFDNCFGLSTEDNENEQKVINE